MDWFRFSIGLVVAVLLGCSPGSDPDLSGDVSGVASGKAHETKIEKTMPDSIDFLVEDLSACGGRWMNGLFAPIELPVGAPANEVVVKHLGAATPHEVLSVRDVEIEFAGKYTAARIKTERGERVVLMKYTDSSGWWSRSYEAFKPIHKRAAQSQDAASRE